MPDGVTVDNASLTDYDVSTDEGSDGKHVQRVKLAMSADGSVVHVPADADGLLVNLGANNDVTLSEPISVDDNGGSLTIDDGGGSITVDGTVAVTEPVSIDDNGGSITVDGTVTATVGTGATDLGKAEDAVHASGDVGVMVLGVRSDASVPLSPDGDYHSLTIDNSGRLKAAAMVHVQDSHNDPIVSDGPVQAGGRASDAIPTAVSADGDAVWGWRDRRGAAKTVMVDDAGDSAMDGTNNALRVNVVAGAAGGVTHTDDAAFTPATDDVVPAAGFFDDSGTDSVDEGDAGVLRMSANRNLYTQLRDAAGNERGAHVTAANALKVDGSAVTQPVSGTVTASVSNVRGATATVTSVADNAASTTILAANANRLEAIVTNDSSARLYLLFGAGTASTTNYTLSLAQNESAVVDSCTAILVGIWATDPGDGAARVTEITA